MKLRKIIKKEARTALHGSRGIAVVLLLVVMAVSAAINLADAAALRLLGYRFTLETLDSFGYSGNFFYELPALVATLVAFLVRLALIVPLGYGAYNWYLELTDRRRHGVSHIFWPYEGKAAWRGILLSLNIAVKLLIAAPLLLVVPLAITFAGDYPGLPEALAVCLVCCGLALVLVALLLLWAFAQRFAIAPMLICEKYQLTTHQAVKQSVRFTRGHRWELLRFQLSFLPWLLPLLGCSTMATLAYTIMPVRALWLWVTLTVGMVTYLLLCPYYQMSMVMYTRYLYEDGLWRQNTAAAPQAPAPVEKTEAVEAAPAPMGAERVETLPTPEAASAPAPEEGIEPPFSAEPTTVIDPLCEPESPPPAAQTREAAAPVGQEDPAPAQEANLPGSDEGNMN